MSSRFSLSSLLIIASTFGILCCTTSFSFPINYGTTGGILTSSSRFFFLTSSKSKTAIFSSKSQQQQDEQDQIQWDLFLKHQARGKWRGTWTSYDYMGDVLDETIGSVNLLLDPELQTVQHTHEIVQGKISSDCKTCFDSENVKTIHVANYSRGNIGTYRCASLAMCAGPSLMMRSGVMSTELVLTNSGNGSGGDNGIGAADKRLRVIYQHAPVWERGVEPGSCPPHALKLFRTMVAREVLLSVNDRDSEKEGQTDVDPRNIFRNAVPPYEWHQKWGGSSWTWGPQSGDRGWSIEELEEVDAWHGRPTGDTSDVWAMRLSGGILLQCPRIISTGRVGLCRLAWLLPEEEGEEKRLLRVEAGIMALEPVIDEENDVMLGFYPPDLASLRCDVLQKYGELENVSMIEKLKSMGEMGQVGTGELDPVVDDELGEAVAEAEAEEKENGGNDSNDGGDVDARAIRNALKL